MMSDPERYTEELPEGQVLGRVEIVRTMTEDGLIDSARAADPAGEDLPLAEALGMMRLGEDTLIRERMGETDVADELAALRERVDRIENLLGISHDE
jgi:hypothetical protein